MLSGASQGLQYSRLCYPVTFATFPLGLLFCFLAHVSLFG